MVWPWLALSALPTEPRVPTAHMESTPLFGLQDGALIPPKHIRCMGRVPIELHEEIAFPMSPLGCMGRVFSWSPESLAFLQSWRGH